MLYLFDNWSPQGGSERAVLHIFPSTTDQDLCLGVELLILKLWFGVKSSEVAGNLFCFAPNDSHGSTAWSRGEQAKPGSAAAKAAPERGGESRTSVVGAASVAAEAAVFQPREFTPVSGTVESSSAELTGGLASSVTKESRSTSSFRIQ